MDECCCPQSGAAGSAVALRTVKALLTMAAMRRLGKGPYRFCPDAGCDVVYFDRGGAWFTRADVRVPVWQKEPPGQRLLCYCFDETDPERVRAHIRAGRCACDVRNPRGACCLEDLNRWSASLQAGRNNDDNR